MFDNYQEAFGDRLLHISSLADALEYVYDMLDYFGIQLFYDPKKEFTIEEGEDDPFLYCQVVKTLLQYEKLITLHWQRKNSVLRK